MKVFQEGKYVTVALSGENMWTTDLLEVRILGLNFADTPVVKVGQENLLLLSATEKFLDGGYLGPK